MALQQGERYRCPDEKCGAEVQVTKGADPGCQSNHPPRCCCGREMEKVNA